MTGQSSVRGKCVMPSVYQRTTSRSSTGRFAAVHCGSPLADVSRLGASPAAYISSGAYGVTHISCDTNPAVRRGAEGGEESGIGWIAEALGRVIWTAGVESPAPDRSPSSWGGVVLTIPAAPSIRVWPSVSDL